MASKEVVSQSGNWKLVVEAFSVNWFVYRAMGATSRAYQKTTSGWKPLKVEFITANGYLTSSAIPGGGNGRIPDSPNSRRNDSEADCRAWAVFLGVKFAISPGGGLENPSPTFSYEAIADGVVANGSARFQGESLSLSQVIYSP